MIRNMKTNKSIDARNSLAVMKYMAAEILELNEMIFPSTILFVLVAVTSSSFVNVVGVSLAQMTAPVKPMRTPYDESKTRVAGC